MKIAHKLNLSHSLYTHTHTIQDGYCSRNKIGVADNPSPKRASEQKRATHAKYKYILNKHTLHSILHRLNWSVLPPTPQPTIYVECMLNTNKHQTKISG